MSSSPTNGTTGVVSPPASPWSFERATPNPIVDEPINRWLHRRLAYALLVLCRPFAAYLSPNLLTVIGTLLGVASGAALVIGAQPGVAAQRTELTLIAAACLVLSVVFDCSDGMFARLTGKSSKLGMILDGASDTIVYTSVWVGLAVHLSAAAPMPWLWPIAVITALVSFTQIASFDQVKNRYQKAMAGEHDPAKAASVGSALPPSLSFMRPFVWIYDTLYPLSVRSMIGVPLHHNPGTEAVFTAVTHTMRAARWLGLGLHMALLYTFLVLLAFAPHAALPYLCGGVLAFTAPVIVTRWRWRRAIQVSADAA